MCHSMLLVHFSCVVSLVLWAAYTCFWHSRLVVRVIRMLRIVDMGALGFSRHLSWSSKQISS